MRPSTYKKQKVERTKKKKKHNPVLNSQKE